MSYAVRSFLYVFILCAICVTYVTAQSWQPAVQIDGAILNINIVTLPNGTTLIPLRRVLPNQMDTNMFFSVQSLLGDRKPWRDQLSGLPYIRRVFDGNGNGFPEVEIGKDGDSIFYYDAFSPNARLVDAPAVGGSWPISGEMVVYEGTLDDDGYSEQFVARKQEQYARIVYGGYPDPYLKHSVVLANYQRSNERRAKIMAVGRLSGRTCMLQLAYKADTYDSGYYQLLELNQDDVQARRDTIRTTLLNEVANSSGRWLSGVVLKADTVWHLFAGGTGVAPLSLKVTVSESSIRMTQSVMQEGDHMPWYGQRKEKKLLNFPVTMNAHRLIARESSITPGGGQRVLRLYKCSNTDSALLTTFADAQLPVHADSNRLEAIQSMALIPDHDGDGIEDVIVCHVWIPPGNTIYKVAVSIYLTTQIQTVTVGNDPPKITDFDKSKTMPSYRSGQGWVVPNATRCYHIDTAPVYNSIGERIGSLRVDVSGPDVIIHDDGRVGQVPAWCVIGNCVIRLH